VKRFLILWGIGSWKEAEAQGAEGKEVIFYSPPYPCPYFPYSLISPFRELLVLMRN